MAALVLALAACQQKAAAPEAAANATPDTLRYEGVLPAADGPGIRYELAFAQDSTRGFAATVTYLEAENGQDQSYSYTGRPEEVTVQRDGKEVKGIKLPFEKDEALYLLQVNDSTYRVVNDSLEEAATDLNYDLKLK